jgi:predicted PurR-regulated permease PerM
VLPIGLWVIIGEITLVLGAVPAVLTAPFSGGLEGGILVALFLLLARQLEGNVLVLRIMGSSFGVHPLLVLFATLAVTAPYGLDGTIFVVPVVAIIVVALRYLRWTLLFEHWHLLPVVEVVVERAPGLAASGKEVAGLRGCSAGGEG